MLIYIRISYEVKPNRYLPFLDMLHDETYGSTIEHGFSFVSRIAGWEFWSHFFTMQIRILLQCRSGFFFTALIRFFFVQCRSGFFLAKRTSDEKLGGGGREMIFFGGNGGVGVGAHVHNTVLYNLQGFTRALSTISTYRYEEWLIRLCSSVNIYKVFWRKKNFPSSCSTYTVYIYIFLLNRVQSTAVYYYFKCRPAIYIAFALFTCPQVYFPSAGAINLKKQCINNII